jgi:arginine/serine-rich splicing factor 17
MEFLRLEAEIESKGELKGAIAKLDQKTIRLANVSEPLKLKAAEARIPFPTRNDWDSYFRDAKNMNEMKAGKIRNPISSMTRSVDLYRCLTFVFEMSRFVFEGERPDTIKIEMLPSRWFLTKDDMAKNVLKPDQILLKQAFQIWGEVRVVDIPNIDPLRGQMSPSISG